MISLNNAEIGYPNRRLLHAVNLEFTKGEMLILEGANGSGKTTLAKVLLGNLKPLKGDFCNHFLRTAYVPQRSMLDNQYPLTVSDIIADGELVSLKRFWHKGSRAANKEKVERLLKDTGLSGAGDLPLREASGGQLQRALIARALISEPDFILLDEPFSNLDKTGRTIMLEIISRLWKENKTTFFLIDHFGYLPFQEAKKYRIEGGGVVLLE